MFSGCNVYSVRSVTAVDHSSVWCRTHVMIWPGFWMLPLPTAGTPPRRARRGVCSSLPTWPPSRNSSGTSTPRQVVSCDKYSRAKLNIVCFGLLSEHNIRDMSYHGRSLPMHVDELSCKRRHLLAYWPAGPRWNKVDLAQRALVIKLKAGDQSQVHT